MSVNRVHKEGIIVIDCFFAALCLVLKDAFKKEDIDSTDTQTKG